MSKAKKRVRQPEEKNTLEMLLGGFDQILGSSSSEKKQKLPTRGEMRPGEEVSFAKPQEEKPEEQEEKATITPAIEYSREINQMAEIAIRSENKELEIQLREIMMEIKKLADSSKELQMQFKEVAVEQHVAKPGKYHKNFFSWLLSIIRSARMKIEDSGAWLQAMQSKKKAKGYWQMAKKGANTSFTLSNERNVSTQVG